MREQPRRGGGRGVGSLADAGNCARVERGNREWYRRPCGPGEQHLRGHGVRRRRGGSSTDASKVREKSATKKKGLENDVQHMSNMG